VLLPYGNGRLAMTVMLPNMGDSVTPRQALQTLEDSITTADAHDRMATILRPVSMREVELYLPQFEADWKSEVSNALRACGVAKVFDRSVADFGGISETPLFISNVNHAAKVRSGEDGTVAAAATAAVMETCAAIRDPDPVINFRADHPFVFCIHDSTTDQILFLGRVVNPGPGWSS